MNSVEELINFSMGSYHMAEVVFLLCMILCLVRVVRNTRGKDVWMSFSWWLMQLIGIKILELSKSLSISMISIYM